MSREMSYPLMGYGGCNSAMAPASGGRMPCISRQGRAAKLRVFLADWKQRPFPNLRLGLCSRRDSCFLAGTQGGACLFPSQAALWLLLPQAGRINLLVGHKDIEMRTSRDSDRTSFQTRLGFSFS